jgi:hypothetical protein
MFWAKRAIIRLYIKTQKELKYIYMYIYIYIYTAFPSFDFYIKPDVRLKHVAYFNIILLYNKRS